MQPEHGETTQTLDDPITEAQRLISAAEDRDLTLRLLGGVGIRLRSPHAGREPLARTYADLDFVAPKKESKALRSFLEASGYTADRRFNALHGAQRLLFVDEARDRQIDIFLGTFEMCHKLPIEDRLTLHPQTLSPADLLLTKLQIFEFNRKDALDAVALLLDYTPTAGASQPDDVLDLDRITDITSRDWGWYTTLSDNLDRVAEIAGDVLTAADAETTRERVVAIKHAMDQAPKSLGWRARDKVGRRVAWYELPEEVRR
jgi:hypothetical protein